LQVARVARIVRIFRLLRLLRIARLTRLPQFMLRLEAVVGRVALQLIGLCASVLLLLHWAACVCYYLSWAQDNANNWVRHNGYEQSDNLEKVSVARGPFARGYRCRNPTNLCMLELQIAWCVHNLTEVG
jgi:hypothetical protein